MFESMQYAIELQEGNKRLREINAELLEACKNALQFISENEWKFPKSIRQPTTFQLNVTRAKLGTAIYNAEVA